MENRACSISIINVPNAAASRSFLELVECVRKYSVVHVRIEIPTDVTSIDINPVKSSGVIEPLWLRYSPSKYVPGTNDILSEY
jgi:hypothetical protein